MKLLANGVYAPEPTVEADANLTQLITVTTAGTPVQGPDVSSPGRWTLKADPANTGNVWFMFWGQTAEAKGFPLAAGEPMLLAVENLSDIGFDADTSGDKIRAVKM